MKNSHPDKIPRVHTPRPHMLPNLSMLAVSAPLTEEELKKRREQGRQNYIEWRERDEESQAYDIAKSEIAEREEVMPNYFVDWTEDVWYERYQEFERRQAEDGQTDDEMENESPSSADGAATDIDESQPMDTLAALQTIIQRQERQIAAFRHSIQSYQSYQRQSQSMSGGAAEASAIG